MAELFRQSTTGLNISTETEVLSWTVTGPNPREVIARLDLGGITNHLSGSGGTYSIRFYVNGVQVMPTSDVDVAAGLMRIITVSRPVPVSTGDLVSVRVVGLAGDTNVDSICSLRNATPVLASDISGDGSVQVNHDYGGADALAYKTLAGQGIDGAVIRAYLKSSYDAGNVGLSFVLAQTGTDVNGRWLRPFMLDPTVYTLIFFKQGQSGGEIWGPDRRDLTVS